MLRTLAWSCICAGLAFALTLSANAEERPNLVEQTFRNEKDLATIYIYREERSAGAALQPTVFVAEKPLVDVPDGGLYVGHFPPGHYTFQMDDKQTGAELDLAAGDRYFFKMLVIPGFFVGGGQLNLVQPQQGSFEIKRAHRVPKSAVRDRGYESNEEKATITRADMLSAVPTLLSAFAGARKMPAEAEAVSTLRTSGDATLTDAWGTPFRYVVSDDRKTARFVSAGADKKFDESSWSSEGVFASLGEDSVVEITPQGGRFTRSWK